MKTNFTIKFGSKKQSRSIDIEVNSTREFSLAAQAFPLNLTVTLNNIPIVYEHIQSFIDDGVLEVFVDKSISINKNKTILKFEVPDIVSYFQIIIWINDFQNKTEPYGHRSAFLLKLESYNDDIKLLPKQRFCIGGLNFKRENRVVRISDSKAVDFPILSLNRTLFAGHFGKILLGVLYQLTCQLLNIKEGGTILEEHQIEYLIKTYFAKYNELNTDLNIHPTIM